MIVGRGLGLDTDEYGIITTFGYGLNPIPVSAAGGSGMHRQRLYWDDRELRRIQEEEEIIMLMAGHLW